MADSTFIIIPAYNEASRIGNVIENSKRQSRNIIVVDDGSTDSTKDVAKSYKITVLRHIINLGKGAALKTGCEFAYGEGAESFILMDSDGQHDPKEIPAFKEALEGADIVFGYRTFDKRMPLVLRSGNRLIRLFSSLLFNIKIRDTQSGFKAFTREAYEKIKWESMGYSVESEMIARTGKHKLRFRQIPIETIYGDDYKGTTFVDGVKIVLNMIKWKLSADGG